MSRAPHSNRRRLVALLADRAVFGLDPARQRELERLASASVLADLESLDRVAAMVALSGLADRIEPMPDCLRQTLRRTGAAAVSAGSPSNHHES